MHVFNDSTGSKLPSRTVVCSYVCVRCVGGGGLMWHKKQNTLIPLGAFSKYTCLAPRLRKFDKPWEGAMAGMFILNELRWWSDALSGWENWFGRSCYVLLKWNEPTTRNPRRSSKEEAKWKERKMLLGSVCLVETFITINTFFFIFSLLWLIFLHAKHISAATSVFLKIQLVPIYLVFPLIRTSVNFYSTKSIYNPQNVHCHRLTSNI